MDDVPPKRDIYGRLQEICVADFNFNNMSDDDRIKIFENVLKNNNWSHDELIVSRTDNVNKYKPSEYIQYGYLYGEIFNGLRYNIYNSSIIENTKINIVDADGLNFLNDEQFRNFLDNLIRERGWDKRDVIVADVYVLNRWYDTELYIRNKYYNGQLTIEVYDVDLLYINV